MEENFEESYGMAPLDEPYLAGELAEHALSPPPDICTALFTNYDVIRPLI
jgi:hypothetical protein